MSNNYEFDFVFIGSGPGGYYAAIRAAQFGARVAVVEKGPAGGTCLNVGCIPTKALLGCVAVLDHVKHGAAFGVKVSGYSLDIPAMMDHKNKVVKSLVTGVEGLLRKNKIKYVKGCGRITDAHTVSVESNGETQALQTDKIIIATGSETALLPLPGFEISDRVWTSTEALEFTQVPKSILIVGAGAIGLEAGYTFARMGTDVTIVELMSQILPAADTETANELQKNLEKAGMKFMLDTTVAKAEDTAAGKKVWTKSGNEEVVIEAEKVLVAVGRRAVIRNIGLEDAGVKTDGRKVLVNEHMQTNIPNIYAIGDAVGEPMLAHVAWAEGVVAVEHALGNLNAKMDYSAFPACVYTTPECASVGMTEKQARERYGEIRIGKAGFAHNGKAMGIRETEGFIKFICDARYGRILGVHMVGPHVTDLITQTVQAMKNELTLDEVIATIHPHPTLSEQVQEAALDVWGKAIHK